MKINSTILTAALALSLPFLSAAAGKGKGKGKGNGNDNGGGNGGGGGRPDKEEEEVEIIVKYKDAVGKNAAKGASNNGKFSHDLPGLNTVSFKGKRGQINRLKNDPHVKYVEESRTLYALPNMRGPAGVDGSRKLQEDVPYGINIVQANQVSQGDVPAGADPFKICVVDTGYDVNHPDLPSNAQGFSDYVEQDASQIWNVDGHGHGTHCAGTIGAIGNNNQGVTSVNPDQSKFSFFIGKGLRNSGSGSSAGVMAAVEACVLAGAKVVSMSLGGGGASSIEADAYEQYYDSGVLIVAAAGNSGNSALSYPASYPHVMSVAASDSSNNLASFSQYNSQVEITAPGVGIQSTLPNNSYDAWSGTSMATPHVAGVAALVWSNFPECSNSQIRQVLLKTALKVAPVTECNINYGHGIVQAKEAYDLLAEEGCAAGDDATDLGGCAQLPGPPTPPPTPCPGHTIEVDITPDNYPSETSWTIVDECLNAEIGSGALSSTGAMCATQGNRFKFTIFDSWGDGICCSYGIGSYSVLMDNTEVADGGEFLSQEEKYFGAASCGVSTPPPTPQATSPPITPAPTPPPTAESTPPPTLPPTNPPTLPPTPPPTNPPTQLCKLVSVTITDSNGQTHNLGPVTLTPGSEVTSVDFEVVEDGLETCPEAQTLFEVDA